MAQARILFVDDDKRERSIVRRFLERAGYCVMTAPDREQALWILTAEPIDVVLTDVFLCGMSGLEVASTIKQSFPTIQIIFYSGAVTPPTGYQEISSLFVSKGENVTQLLQILAIVTGSRRLLPAHIPGADAVERVHK